MRSDREAEPAWSAGSSLALVVLAGLAVSCPWPFGSVQPLAVSIVSGLALAAAAIGFAVGPRLPHIPLWPALSLLSLGLLHLVPLPPALHALLAPGSYALWHPAEPAAAAVLGPGARPVSIDPVGTLHWLALSTGLFLLALAAAPALARGRSALHAAVAVVTGGVLLSCYGIFARARFGPLLYGRIAVPTVSPFGPFVSKNHFAGYVEMATLLGLGLVLGLADLERARRSGSASRAVAALVASLAMALGVAVSGSRGGALSLCAGALFLLAARVGLARRSRTAPAIAALAAALVVGASLLAVLPPDTRDRLRSLAGASFRVGTWVDATRAAGSSPWVGYGMGTFHDAYPRFKRGHGDIRVEHAENDYVEILLDGGVVGLGLGLTGLVALFAFALGRLRDATDPLRRGLGLGALAALASLAVHSALDFNLRIPSNAALAAFALSLVAAAGGLRPRPVPTAAALSLTVALAALLAARVVVQAPPSLPGAEREVRSAATSDLDDVRRLRLERAEKALLSLVRARPARAEPWLYLAWIRAAREPEQAATLARYAASLDPQRQDLQSEAKRLAGPPGAGPTE